MKYDTSHSKSAIAASPAKCLLVSLAALVLFSVAGCFDYREEIWINPDLSGSISMEITVGEIFVNLYEQSGQSADLFSEEGIQSHVADIEGITLISAKSYTAEENRRITLTLTFNSIDALREVLRKTRGVHFTGDIAIVDGPDGMEYTRMVSLEDSTISALALYDQDRNKRFWLSTVHFPGYISETNAPNRNIDEKTQSRVSWGYSFDALLAEPRSMEATFSLPSRIKTIPAVMAGVVFIAVIAVLYRLLTPKPRKRKA